ncbi:MFS general substrate transporter [Zopfia rhizophila CBS 207.26]|uniref:MFS general substrate transporter n=1 Tax=Zopfia rhizophila CBS 207.26 TaxID=1314779 RepID=A0A6A6DLD3_9PEZI|nr:MFS general substrate transporter [Zopfia rhizophila CBS 207.26]
MERDETVHDETTTLLENEYQQEQGLHESCSQNGNEDQGVGSFSPEYILPLALFAALAMASTAATEYFAYATLLCKDPRQCEGGETSKYAGFIAAATSVANILGMLALGPLQKLSTINRKLGLLLWMCCRSMSAVMLLLGVYSNSIYVALFGRVFEGLASDNLLHFTLNAVYTQSSNQKKISSLIGYSLALYMVGISVSPFVAGLFKNFTVSFFMALGIFGFAVAYLQLCVTSRTPKGKARLENSSRQADHRDRPSNMRTYGRPHNLVGRISSTMVAPLRDFKNQPLHFVIGLSLFAYNIIQSYIFSALLVHTSVKFGFTGRENGFIITIAHSVAALYIFLNLYLIPRLLTSLFRTQMEIPEPQHYSGKRDAIFALTSLTLQALSLIAIGWSTKTWQVYAITALLALGLPTPSFIKAYFVGHFEGSEKSAALASLAMMEASASVLGPMVLGGWQSFSGAGGGVFFVAAGISGFSIVAFGVGSLILSRKSGLYLGREGMDNES